MSDFEPRDWYTLDMATKIRLFSLMFPRRPRRHLHRELDGTLILPKLDTNIVLWPPPPKLVRHDTSIGGWVAERHVTFQDQEFPAHVRQMIRELRCSPPSDTE
jgi:hypothetical protein